MKNELKRICILQPNEVNKVSLQWQPARFCLVLFSFADIAITLSRCMWVCMFDDKTKTPDRNDLKLGTVVVLDTLSKPIFGSKGQVSELGSSFRTFGTGCHLANKTDYYLLRK